MSLDILNRCLNQNLNVFYLFYFWLKMSFMFPSILRSVTQCEPSRRWHCPCVAEQFNHLHNNVLIMLSPPSCPSNQRASWEAWSRITAR